MIINKLYNNSVTLNFDGFKHRYTVNAETIPSVTGVLSVINKPALINWAARTAIEYVAAQIDPGVTYDEIQLAAIWQAGKSAHYQKKVDAGDLGTFTHKWVEDYIKGNHPGMPVNEGLKASVNQFTDWVAEHQVQFLMSEQPIYSKKYKYAGTLDFICKIDGQLFIGDLKTSSGIYDEMWIQTAAYRQARSEEYPEEKYVGQLIVRIGKDGSFEFAKMTDTIWYNKMLMGFISALKLKEVLTSLEEFKPDK